MQTVIAVNLNGNAYHVEERGYEALRDYLERAAAALADNPDKNEIVADLEQAIADKCTRHLGPGKTVITAPEITQILQEMGPVDAGNDDEKTGGSNEAGDGAAKRLYLIREGSIIAGVCTGLSAYFSVDVALVRIGFVILAALTKGVWVIVYGVMAFVIPYADTSEQRAAAHGQPFTAKDLIDQAKRNAAAFGRQKTQWQRQWARQQRRFARWQPPLPGRPPWVTVAPLAPFFDLTRLALFVLFLLGAISLVATGEILGRSLPDGVPLWAALLALIVVYHVVAAPLYAARYTAPYPYPPPDPWLVALVRIVSTGVAAFLLWLVYLYVPEFREFVRDDLPRVVGELWDHLARE